MNNKIWIDFPKKIKVDFDNDLEANFQIFKIQGAAESTMSFMLRRMLSANFIPTIQFYNYLSEALLMNGYYLAAENVLLYSNIFLRISNNIDYSNSVEKTSVNKFVNLIVSRNNRSIFDYMKNILNINTIGLEEYFKVFKIDVKKGRECPFLIFSNFNLDDNQLKKFLKNDFYLIFNSNKIFKEHFEERLEKMFYEEIQILEMDNNNFYNDITIASSLKIKFYNTNDGTPTNKAYSFFTNGMFNEALSECLKYIVSPQFIPAVDFYNFFARVLALNGYFSDAKNVLLYAIVGALKSNEFEHYSKAIIDTYKLYTKIFYGNLKYKKDLLLRLFEISDTREGMLASIFNSSDSKEKFLNFIKQDDDSYIFFIKKNTIFNYKEVLVTDKIYSQILSGKIYNDNTVYPIFKNSLLGKTIKKANSMEEYDEQSKLEKEYCKSNNEEDYTGILFVAIIIITLFIIIGVSNSRYTWGV